MRVLIEGCRNHDRESQRLLFKHYYSYALSICIRYSGSEAEAKEIMSDGFLKVFTKIDQYNTEKSFEGWIKRILINTAIDHYRANKKYREQVSIDGHDKQITITALDDLSYNELLLLIQKLSPMYRSVFSLFAIDGYSHEEIAEALDISVGTSKSNLFKARANLKKMLHLSNKEVYEQYI